MTASLADYQYQALSHIDSVRLLSISLDDDKPYGLCLSLKEVNLDDEPVFAALSYTWRLPKYGNIQETQEPGPGRTFEIACDGKLMEISENLFDFLRTILEFRCLSTGTASDTTRKCPPKVRSALESMPLWIDAFCIDQTNTEEKSHQVLLMHRIYSSAQNVLVWLGISEPDSEVQWIHDVFIPHLFKARKRSNIVKDQLYKDPYCSSPEIIVELGPDKCSRWASAWLPFAKLLRENRWFDRGWVVQEVALADPAQIHVMCGNTIMNWKRLGAFVQFMQETRWSHSLEAQLEGSFEHIRFFSDIRRHPTPQILTRTHLGIGDGLYKINGIRPLLSDLVHHTQSRGWDTRSEAAWLACASFIISTLRSFRFGDDRDHIYGCLGMLSMLLPYGFPSPIIPDYTQSVEDVFTSVAACFLQRLPLLSELRHLGKEKLRRYTSLPSWVPDYSVMISPKATRHKRLDGPVGTDASLEALEQREIAIWRGRSRRPSVIGSKLLLHGMNIGKIYQRVSIFSAPTSSYEVAFGIITFLRTRNLYALHSPQLNLWDRLAAAVLNECLGLYSSHMGPLSRRLSKMIGRQIVRYYVPGRREFVRTRLGSFGEETWISAQIRSWVSDFEKLTTDTRPCLHVDPKVWEGLENECFYNTSQGWGLGSCFTKDNDQIWLIEGSSLPFILREATTVPKDSSKLNQLKSFHFIGDVELSGFDIHTSDLTSETQQQTYEEISII